MSLPLPVLSCKLQNINDVMIPALKYFLLLLATFPPVALAAQSSNVSRAEIRVVRWYLWHALAYQTRGSFYQMEYVWGARWCTSAVTKAEIRPRAPQLWHKLGAKKYCWQDLAFFQRRFDKTLTISLKRLFQVVEYEGSNHIKNPEMQRVLLTHEVICR